VGFRLLYSTFPTYNNKHMAKSIIKTKDQVPNWDMVSEMVKGSRFYFRGNHSKSYRDKPLNTYHPKLLHLGFVQTKNSKGRTSGKITHPTLKIEGKLTNIVHPIEDGYYKLFKNLDIPDYFPHKTLIEDFIKMYESQK